ncbi:unnamed protein product [Closterium sp. NIES-64]|nr:unnamed protein product [Closterium sp. NIES-65]CAI5954735.1 unnamed protein product [Closterium sp. NIES-65]CAI5971452.1 unnamed protein product [Closterium sp. NIES-64]
MAAIGLHLKASLTVAKLSQPSHATGAATQAASPAVVPCRATHLPSHRLAAISVFSPQRTAALPALRSRAQLSIRASASASAQAAAQPSAPPPPAALVIAAVAAASATAAAVARAVLEPLRRLFAPLSAAEQLQLDTLTGRATSMIASGKRLAACAAPLFFAAISQSNASTSTPLTVIASGMAKWLELYSGLLLVRVLLSWFPNIDWERQPMQAIRDMSDPYLNLFRNILPPFFGALDLSPMLAFLVLGMLTSLLNTAVFS